MATPSESLSPLPRGHGHLSSKFLLLTVPAVVVSALIFVAVSFWQRAGEHADINRRLAQQQAEAHAQLLSYPLWNVDLVTAEAIMRSLIEAPRVQCVEVSDVIGMELPTQIGRCEARAELWPLEVPITWVDVSGSNTVGLLRQWVDISPSDSDVWRDLQPLLLQLLVLVGVLILCSLIAFSRTVRRPLAEVADSLRAFRQTGERRAVAWVSDDELGEFIREYNAGLKRQEHAERQLQAQLNLQMALYRTMPTPFAYLDAQLRLVEANPAFHEQLGIGEAARAQSMPALLSSVDWASILGLHPGDVHEQELLGMAVRGRERGFTLACSVFCDADRQIRGYVLVLQDITQRLEDEAKLREALARGEATLAELHRTQASLVQSEKLASLGSLVAGIAHEINTPLGTGVTVSSRLLVLVEGLQAAFSSGAMRRSDLQHFLDEAREGCAIMRRSLDAANEQVRRFKQIAVDQVSGQRRRFDLRELVEDAAAAARPQLNHKSQRIETDVPPLLMLDSLPASLEQVLGHCISNAVVHGVGDQAEGRVRVSARMLIEDRVRIEVEDNGRGISADHLRRVFDPFFTTQLGRGGGGLGMSLAYQLVTAVLRGEIGIDSAPGQGTRVWIELPRVLPSVSSLEAAPDSGGSRSPMI